MINLKKTESAVSETVGFVIIFGIMLMGIALVTLYGYPALLDAQENANIRNMERNMISLQSDVNSLTYKAVPYKETTMQVSGGMLSVETPAAPGVTINSFMLEIPDYLDPEEQFPSGALKFLSDTGEIAISLQNGAVVKRQSGGSVMLSEPRWFIDDSDGVKTLVITLIQIDLNDPAKPLAKSGISTVQMSIKPLNIFDVGGNMVNIIEFYNPPNPYTIRIKPPNEYQKAWTNYFEYTLGMTQDGETTHYQRTDIDRIIIKAWKINIINI